MFGWFNCRRILISRTAVIGKPSFSFSKRTFFSATKSPGEHMIVTIYKMIFVLHVFAFKMYTTWRKRLKPLKCKIQNTFFFLQWISQLQQVKGFADMGVGVKVPVQFKQCSQQQSTAPQSGHALLTQVRSMCSWTLPCVSSLVPSFLHLSHTFQCSPKAATDKLMEKIVKHDSWPIQPDILSPPLLRLTFRKPLWLDLQPVDIKSRWRHNWKWLRWSILT